MNIFEYLSIGIFYVLTTQVISTKGWNYIWGFAVDIGNDMLKFFL